LTEPSRVNPIKLAYDPHRPDDCKDLLSVYSDQQLSQRQSPVKTYGYFELVFEPVEIELTIPNVHQLFAPTRKLRYYPTGLQIKSQSELFYLFSLNSTSQGGSHADASS